MHVTTGHDNDPAALVQCAAGTVLFIHHKYGPELVRALQAVFDGKRLVDEDADQTPDG
jgi:hypothetical protein